MLTDLFLYFFYKFHFWDLHFQIYLPVTIVNCYINTCSNMFVGIPWIWYFKMLETPLCVLWSNGSYLLADETITFRISSEMHICRSTLVNQMRIFNFNALFNGRHGWGKQMWNIAKWYDIHVRKRPILDYLNHVNNF
jgi:hypothetical protein